MATTALAQHDYVLAHSNGDELKRKAPGFDRPSSVNVTPVKVGVEEMPMLFAGGVEWRECNGSGSWRGVFV